MTWKLTKFGEIQFKNTELKTFLSDKVHNFLPDSGRFVLEGMGSGHFYLEDYLGESKKPAAEIFFNEEHLMCLFDVAVARWANDDSIN